MPETRRQRNRAAAHPVRRVQPPTVEQVNRLADAMPTPVMRAFVLVAAWSGLRLNEVAKLERRDVTVHDHTAMLHVKYGKGGKERRSVLLEPGLMALWSVGALVPGDGLVLPNALGRRFSRQHFHHHWTQAKPPEVKHFVFHDLRKFHATWLLDHGMTDLDVAIQLGHLDSSGRPDPEYVRRIYGFPSTREALERIANLPTDGGSA